MTWGHAADRVAVGESAMETGHVVTEGGGHSQREVTGTSFGGVGAALEPGRKREFPRHEFAATALAVGSGHVPNPFRRSATLGSPPFTSLTTVDIVEHASPQCSGHSRRRRSSALADQRLHPDAVDDQKDPERRCRYRGRSMAALRLRRDQQLGLDQARVVKSSGVADDFRDV